MRPRGAGGSSCLPWGHGYSHLLRCVLVWGGPVPTVTVLVQRGTGRPDGRSVSCRVCHVPARSLSPTILRLEGSTGHTPFLPNVGRWLPGPPGCPGEDAGGVWSGGEAIQRKQKEFLQMPAVRVKCFPCWLQTYVAIRVQDLSMKTENFLGEVDLPFHVKTQLSCRWQKQDN